MFTTPLTQEDLSGFMNHQLVVILQNITKTLSTVSTINDQEYDDTLRNQRLVGDEIIKRMNQ